MLCSNRPNSSLPIVISSTALPPDPHPPPPDLGRLSHRSPLFLLLAPDPRRRSREPDGYGKEGIETSSKHAISIAVPEGQGRASVLGDDVLVGHASARGDGCSGDAGVRRVGWVGWVGTRRLEQV